MLVKQGHEPAVGKGKLPRGAQSLAADLGFYQQIMGSTECGDDPPGLFFGFLLASGFDQEPLQAFSYAGGSHGEGIDNGQRSLARRQVASALRVPEAFKVVAHLDEHTQIIPEFGIRRNPPLVIASQQSSPAKLQPGRPGRRTRPIWLRLSRDSVPRGDGFPL